MPECPEMAANDVGREGLVVPIALVGLRECVTSLVMDIVPHELGLTIATFIEFVEPVQV